MRSATRIASLGSRSSSASTANSSPPGRAKVLSPTDNLFVFALSRTRNGVNTAETSCQALGNLNEQSISGGVSQAVIENLESVDVDEQAQRT